MSHKVFIVDAFTEHPFGGNPAAVVVLDEPATSEWMQAVAAEMNLSETAFVELSDHGPKHLRWFTPGTEVSLCGHATLATAHVLGGTQVFRTKSGDLHCADRGDGWVQMDFPADLAVDVDAEVADALRIAMGQVRVSKRGMGAFDLVAELRSEAEVVDFKPDFEAIKRIPVRGLIITAPAEDPDVDFVSRCFYPAVQVPEDPVTGSAHCTLATWWAPVLDKTEMVGDQLSERGGRVRVRLDGGRVQLSGKAFTVLEGVLNV